MEQEHRKWPFNNFTGIKITLTITNLANQITIHLVPYFSAPNTEFKKFVM